MEQLLSQENTTQRNKKISGHFGGGCIGIVYLELLFWRLFSIDLFFTYQKRKKKKTLKKISSFGLVRYNLPMD